MPTPRKYLIDPEIPFYYHITSRCVRRAWLMGKDPLTKRNVNHRKEWLVKWLHTIAPAFPLAVQTYAIMSNHFHLVVYYDPKASKRWSDREVAERWLTAHPSQLTDHDDVEAREAAIKAILVDPDRVHRYRKELSSLSAFMKCLKQPIAQRANREDDQDGHFWSQRFYSGAIVSDESLLKVMAYVDLNPVRAKIAAHIEECLHTGLSERMEAFELKPDALDSYLAPCATGLAPGQGRIEVRTKEYKQYVEDHAAIERQLPANPTLPNKDAARLTPVERWLLSKQVLAKQPRAIGTTVDITKWLSARGLKQREPAMPFGLA